MSFRVRFFVSILAILAISPSSFACDLCALHGAMSVQEMSEGFFRLGVTEQYTRFEDIQFNGKDVSNPLSQNLDSSFTQIYTEYNFSDRFGLQLNVPLIFRSFRRPLEDGRIEKGEEQGVGDIAIIAKYAPVNHKANDFFFYWQLVSGLKIPSGDSSRLREETDPDHGHDSEGDSESSPGLSSAIHGHDLALGTGSFDFVIGSAALLQKDRFFASSAIQYFLRTEGDFNYEFADDLHWHFSSGAYAYLDHRVSLSIAARLSGEFKDKDRFEGAAVEDTRITSLSLGPELQLTVGDQLSFGVLFELPLEQEASSLQIVPSHRIIGHLSYKFKPVFTNRDK